MKTLVIASGVWTELPVDPPMAVLHNVGQNLELVISDEGVKLKLPDGMVAAWRRGPRRVSWDHEKGKITAYQDSGGTGEQP